jgi:hypothetical protein
MLIRDDRDMVGAGEVDSLLQAEVKEECAKYGVVSEGCVLV